MKEYLTEESLGIFLLKYFNNGEWIHNKSFMSRFRPDYRNDELRIIVEFDGYLHYTSSKTILNDLKKDELFSGIGYKIIRIPYFVQLSTETIQYLFEFNIEYTQTYKHGFIDDKCVLPSDFCELGIERFKKDIERFDFLKQDIIESLKCKIEKCGDIRCVVPKSLEYLLN